MGLLNKIKGNKQDKADKKDQDVLDMVKEAAKTSDQAPVIIKEDTGRAHRILSNYHLSEKSNIVSADGRYVFKVNPTANKIEIKKAVEAVYDVHVVSVNVVNVAGKNRRYGRKVGRTSDWKKAYVTLKAGEKITGLAEGV